MNKDIRNISKERMHELWRAISMLETPEECESFFVDLCTVAELDDAAEKTGASTATISRVKRSLYYGNGGYRTALDRLSGKEDKGDE